MNFRRRLIFTLFSPLLFFSISNTLLANQKPEQLEGVDIVEHLGETISLQSLTFQDEQGVSARLSTYFKKSRPVILVLAYYRCSHLCNLVLNGLLDSLKKLDWVPGAQFEVLVVSIDPNETPSLAKEKKSNYLKAYNRPDSEKGWHFLTGDESQIQSLASQVGFQYKYDEKTNEYLHASAVFVLTPEGKISRYLYGISYPMKDLRFSLVDASQGRIGTVMDKILLFCFHFDPSKNSYTFRMWRIVQIVLSLQALALILGLFYLHRKPKNPDPVSG